MILIYLKVNSWRLQWIQWFNWNFMVIDVSFWEFVGISWGLMLGS